MSSPRFFCDACGAEVSRSADRCGVCGRGFSSVRCPKCAFVGADALFRDGCPVCGYSARAKASSGDDDFFVSLNQAPKVPAGGLPFWVYFLTAAIAAAVLLAAALVLV